MIMAYIQDYFSLRLQQKSVGNIDQYYPPIFVATGLERTWNLDL